MNEGNRRLPEGECLLSFSVLLFFIAGLQNEEGTTNLNSEESESQINLKTHASWVHRTCIHFSSAPTHRGENAAESFLPISRFWKIFFETWSFLQSGWMIEIALSFFGAPSRLNEVKTNQSVLLVALQSNVCKTIRPCASRRCKHLPVRKLSKHMYSWCVKMSFTASPLGQYPSRKSRQIVASLDTFTCL